MKKLGIISSLVVLSSTYVLANQNLSVGVIVPSKEEFKNEFTLSQNELQEVFEDNYTIRPTVKEFKNKSELEAAYKELKGSKILLSLDPVSSKYLNSINKSNKVIAPFEVDTKLIVEGAKTFKSIHNFSGVDLVTSKEVDATTIKSAIEKELGVTVHINYLEDMQPALNDSIIIYNPTRRNEDALGKYIRDNLDQGIPSFSLFSEEYVDGGALGGLTYRNSQTLLRASALELEKTLLNETYKDEDEDNISTEPVLIFNLSASKRLGIYPDRAALDGAEFVGSFLKGSNQLSFDGAIETALKNNLDLKSSSFDLEAFSYNPKRAKSLRRPQLFGFSDYDYQNDTFSENDPIGAENNLRAGVTLSQSLFQDDIWENIFVQKKNYEAQKEFFRREEVDTIFAAGANYLDVLRADASLNIEKYNLDLTKDFLEIAKNRKEVGISDSADVFRFESRYAQSQTNVMSAKGELETLQRSLNRTLSLPLEYKFKYEPLSLESPFFLSSNKGFLEILENPVKLNKFRQYYVENNRDGIPEIISINYLVEAKERELKTAKRRRFTPEVTAGSTAAWDLTDPWGDNDDGKDEEEYYSLGVSAKLPLYKGGDIAYEKKQLEAELSSIETEKDSIVERFDTVISSQITDLSVRYEQVKNATTSRIASEKNLELVRDNYAKGTVSITNLLDAQTDAVNSKQEEVIATYGFLIALLDLERSIGTYYFSSDNLLKRSVDSEINTINNNGRKS